MYTSQDLLSFKDIQTCKDIGTSMDIVSSKDLVSHMIEHQIKQNRRKCPSPRCHGLHILPSLKHVKKPSVTHGWLNSRPLMQHNITSGTMECCFCSYVCGMDSYAMGMHITHKHDSEVRCSVIIEETNNNKLTPQQRSRQRALARALESKRWASLR